MTQHKLQQLENNLTGKLYYNETMRSLYATDASVYRELPLAVAIPADKEDLKKLIAFASKEHTSLIPRAAGTSLAGQVVGNGIVVDISESFNRIIEINIEESYAIVEPGVIRDDLNRALKPYGLFFGPETSTSNRCMIGGMVGNNSCGARSVIYGSVREHLLSAKVLLADGSETEFKALTKSEFLQKANGIGTVSASETAIYKQALSLFSKQENRDEIVLQYPKERIPRRNTGYALDLLMKTSAFTEATEKFNFCKLLAGSEGTLAFTTEVKLNLVAAPSSHQALICMHFDSVDEALKGNIEALKFNPSACELIDHYILACTKSNREQTQNRLFLKGDPKAILVVEFFGNTDEELKLKLQKCVEHFESNQIGCHFPIIFGEDIEKVWDLRKAGLGLLSNIPGDAKPVAVIEDTAVDVEDLPLYIEEFNEILKLRGLHCVHYAHAATGELHLRPIINLKTQEGNKLFRTIATDIAQLVKKYKGSLSGEHGDGRLRGEFLPFMIGEKNYQHCKDIKSTWDPEGIFNPGKIVNTTSMNSSLRFMPGYETKEFSTLLDFSEDKGMLPAVEKCNGSGDCRKPEAAGGVMCPSYRVTGEEKHSTRARANILREILSSKELEEALVSKEVKDVLALCLSCKACKSECPSNVDMAKLKAEYEYQRQKRDGFSFRSRLFAHSARFNNYASKLPSLYNYLIKSTLSASVLKGIIGVAQQRSLPILSRETLNTWYRKYEQKGSFKEEVYLFNDEFSNYHHSDIGIKCILLLNSLGYRVIIPEHCESGRAYISKGMLEEARKLAIKNVKSLSQMVSHQRPIIGLEPSAILSLRDEYIDLVPDKSSAKTLAANTFTFEEFIANEIDKGNINSSSFTTQEKEVHIHGHCYQKALSSMSYSKKALSVIKNYKLRLIPSGCCGMAGSFGFEKEHYPYSIKMAELSLLPHIRKQDIKTLIMASGTSCRHQIKEGVNRKAIHPVEIFYDALV